MLIIVNMFFYIEKEQDYVIMVFDGIPKPLCHKDCNSMNGNKHIAQAQRLLTLEDGTVIKNYNQNELYIIPEQLIREILTVIPNS